MNKGTELKGRLDRIGKTPLEHFQDIKELEVADGPEIKVEDIVPYKCKQVEKALHRLESIDNAEPSEALECLMYLKAEFRDYPSAFNSIKNALLKAQKEHKALEIIKEKNVNMFGFKRDIKQLGNRFTYKYYQSNLGNYHSGFDIQELTEEEFNLLKEVLE